MKEPLASLAACVLITALSFIDPADAHSWYDADCCGDTDCHRVPCDEISEEPDGFHWQYGPRRVDELVFAAQNCVRREMAIAMSTKICMTSRPFQFAFT